MPDGEDQDPLAEDYAVLPVPDREKDPYTLSDLFDYVSRLRYRLKSALMSEEHHRARGHECSREDCDAVRLYSFHKWDGWEEEAEQLLEKEWPPPGIDPNDYSLQDVLRASRKAKGESPKEYMRRVLQNISPEHFAERVNRLLQSDSDKTLLSTMNMIAKFGGFDISEEMDVTEPPRTQFSTFLLDTEEEDDNE